MPSTLMLLLCCRRVNPLRYLMYLFTTNAMLVMIKVADEYKVSCADLDDPACMPSSFTLLIAFPRITPQLWRADASPPITPGGPAANCCDHLQLLDDGYWLCVEDDGWDVWRCDCHSVSCFCVNKLTRIQLAIRLFGTSNSAWQLLYTFNYPNRGFPIAVLASAGSFNRPAGSCML